MNPVLHIEQPGLQTMQEEPFRRWIDEDGCEWALFYREGKDYRVRFPGLSDFSIAQDGARVVARPVPEISPQTIEHLWLNLALPLALSRQMKLVLHASAVEIHAAAAVFLGASGRGKSTLAASFATSGQGFLTDDGLQLAQQEGKDLVLPSHPSIRLWDDSRLALVDDAAERAPALDYTPKVRFLAGAGIRFCEAPRRLGCVYFLGPGQSGDIHIAPVSGRDAMIELVSHSFLLDVEERDMLRHQFQQLTRMASTPRFFSLDYPRDYAYLPQVREAIISHCREYGAEAGDRIR